MHTRVAILLPTFNGEKYLAEQLEPVRRKVAVKVIRPELADDPEFIRRFDGEAKVVVCEGNFHGHTITVISASTGPESYARFGPHTPGFVKIPYDDAAALDRATAVEKAACLERATAQEKAAFLAKASAQEKMAVLGRVSEQEKHAMFERALAQ